MLMCCSYARTAMHCSRRSVGVPVLCRPASCVKDQDFVWPGTVHSSTMQFAISPLRSALQHPWGSPWGKLKDQKLSDTTWEAEF